MSQFLIWMGEVLPGNLGTSIESDQPVIDMILRSFPVTAQVVVLATFFAACVVLPGRLLAANAAFRPDPHPGCPDAGSHPASDAREP